MITRELGVSQMEHDLILLPPNSYSTTDIPCGAFHLILYSASGVQSGQYTVDIVLL